jgi:hypothetical protein
MAMGKAKPKDSLGFTKMVNDARANEGIASVRFLGTSWARRKTLYWRRRFTACLLYFAVMLFAGSIATAFAVAFLIERNHFIGVPLFFIWVAPAYWGARDGYRAMVDHPSGFSKYSDFSREQASGCLGMARRLLAFYGVASFFVIFLFTLRKDFPGERQARIIYEYLQSEDPGRYRPL